ncbi:MAG: right-handed parallel beta-helix repeat-containing protein [Gammaproteobacteria bacterium]
MIEGPPEAPGAVFFARRGANTVSIANAAYITIRNLEIDGRGLGMDGVKAEGNARYADHITLDNLFIHNLGGGLQTVGISTKCAAWGWVVRRNVIVGAGTGMYFGNSDGKVPFLDSVIEHNVVRDTLGYNLQIKHQPWQPLDLPGYPRARTEIIIRYNTFSKAHNAEGDPRARPNVLTGHGPLRGPGRSDAVVVYDNLFYQNPVEALFQGEGNIYLYNNVFINQYQSGSPAIAIQPHHSLPREIRIFHNTVISRGTGIAIIDGSSKYQQWVWANAVFADVPIRGGKRTANITAGYDEAASYLRSPFATRAGIDLRPEGRKLKCDTSPPFSIRGLPEAQRDYFGNRRGMSVCGAVTPGHALDKTRIGVTVEPIERRTQ